MLFDCCTSSHAIITSRRIFQQQVDVIARSMTRYLPWLFYSGLDSLCSSISPVCGVGPEQVTSRPLLSLWEGLKKSFLLDEACVEPDEDSQPVSRQIVSWYLTRQHTSLCCTWAWWCWRPGTTSSRYRVARATNSFTNLWY